MERRLTIEFGPSRSKRFRNVVAAARRGPGPCVELEPGRYRLSYQLGADASLYRHLASLLQATRSWRTTEVYQGSHPVSSYQVREMAWCASEQLGRYGDCHWHFLAGIPARCTLCPLFNPKRASQHCAQRAAADQRALETLPARPEPGLNAITDLDFLVDIRDLLDGQIPDWIDLTPLVPDFPPPAPDEPTNHEQ